MRVFVTGATGVLGTRLVERLTDRGHDAIGLVRDDAGATLVEELGGEPRRGDVLDPESLERAMDKDNSEGVDAIVHAATSIPVKTKPTEEDWEKNDQVRLEGAKNLLDVADDFEQFVFPSVVWVARQPDGSPFDESSERHPDRATRSAAEVEDILRERASRERFDATILRCGFFYAPDANHTRQWGEQLLAGDLPVVGGGLLGRQDAELSFIHADDAARAFADALDASASGVYHVVDDEPVTVAQFFGTFADLLDAPEPSRIPGWLARFFVGKVSAELLTTSMPTTSEKFRQEVGWEPECPTYREGLQQVVETWREDKTLQELRSESTSEVEAAGPQEGVA